MIPGLLLIPHFIDGDEERQLVADLDSCEPGWERAAGQRPTQQYGYSYHFTARTLATADPVPQWLQPLCERVSRTPFAVLPQQVIANGYETAMEGIAPHIDHALFGAAVASLSLLSSTVMTFRRSREQPPDVPVLLEPRSLLILTGEARTDWYHDIGFEPVLAALDLSVPKRRRVSITFRTLLVRGGSV